MDITIINPEGLHRSEVRAIQRMRDSLRPNWKGYAAFEVFDNVGGMEFDVLLITHDRLLVVELKEWNGNLTSRDGFWYLGERRMGKSPLKTKNLHCKRLVSIFDRELRRELKYAYRIDVKVVLCGDLGPAFEVSLELD